MIKRAVSLFSIALVLCLGGGPARAAWFERGDVDGSGTRNVVDPFLILRALFQADQFKLGCPEAADVDDNGQVEITDAIALLQYLFVKGPRPWPESLLPGCWIDETADSLGCDRAPACGPRGVFYVCDKSGSQAEGDKFKRLINAVKDGIAQLSGEDQFAVLFFDSSLYKFPTNGRPAPATPELKTEAFAFAESLRPGSGTCPKPAFISALSFAEQSTAREKEILFISDGFATCPGSDMATYQNQLLSELEERNTGGVRIDVLSVDSISMDEEWLRKIAEQNGGTFGVLK